MNRIALLGTGMVGKAWAERLLELSIPFTVGARDAGSDSLAHFAQIGASTGSFADAAAAGDLVVNATNGNHSLEALERAGAQNLAGKPLVDLGNKLDHSRGMACAALASADNCLGAEIQDRFPDARVVKAFNTMNCNVMVRPEIVPGEHVVFMSGDDGSAKSAVRELMHAFGWRESQIVDLGGIESATGPEMMMAAWLGVVMARGGFDAGPFNWAIASG